MNPDRSKLFVRGKAHTPQMSTRLRDFSKLCWGTITPTDLDAFLDFNNRLFVLIEAKYGDAELPKGQRIALERICDAVQKAGIEAILIVGKEPPDTPIGTPIDFGELIVVNYYWRGKWPASGESLAAFSMKEFVDRVRNKLLR